MFDTFFKWLRRKSAESVLAGVNDAARQLQDEQETPGPPLLIWQPPTPPATEEASEKPKREKAKAASA